MNFPQGGLAYHRGKVHRYVTVCHNNTVIIKIIVIITVEEGHDDFRKCWSLQGRSFHQGRSKVLCCCWLKNLADPAEEPVSPNTDPTTDPSEGRFLGRPTRRIQPMSACDPRVDEKIEHGVFSKKP